MQRRTINDVRRFEKVMEPGFEGSKIHDLDIVGELHESFLLIYTYTMPKLYALKVNNFIKLQFILKWVSGSSIPVTFRLLTD